MPLEKRHIRDGENKIIGNVTSGFSDESSVVRDEGNRIVGRTSDKYHTTRRLDASIVSIDTADVGLLIPKK